MTRRNNKKLKNKNDVTIISSLINIEGKLDLEGSVRIDGRDIDRDFYERRFFKVYYPVYAWRGIFFHEYI